MKRKILLSILLTVCFIPIFVSAKTRMYFSNEELNIAPGQTKTVDVLVESDEDFTAASFNVITTSNSINFQSVNISEEFSRGEGKGYVLISKKPKKSGTAIATITLKASASAEIGTSGLIRLINSTVTTSEKEELEINQVKVTVNNEKSSNNNLSSMSSSLAEINFSNDVTEYSVTVPSDTETFDLNATAEDQNANVNISDQKLKESKTDITVTVTAENGEVKEYKVVVNKEKKETTKVKQTNEKAKTEAKKENYKSKWVVILIILLCVFVLDILYMKKKK